MQLKYAHLADYAAPGSNNKPLIVGVFENVFVVPGNAIGLPICYLIGAFTAHLSEGSEHQLQVVLTDADGAEIMRADIALNLTPTPRRTLEGVFTVGIVGMGLPHMGAYDFNLFVDGVHRGAVSFYVTETPQLQ